ncbi:hypothetical protein J3A64_000178 [Pseudarthrobacter sp. PvP004]|uniref:hypothetical protein n=1 Tax=Pseudarthrobacter sp. PvP004 TaxID=2817850 RepID=UPI001AE18582|nr:hypothetical protein [Pseudarthrobacter sp. PvP004]MBP2264714.1 hypothetical protein [Pseudarthrobacter sp. PvP004]
MAHFSNSSNYSCAVGNRTLHAIDLENELGGVDASPQEISDFFHVWSLHTSTVTPGDRVIVAMSHRLAKRAWFVLPRQGIQRVVGSGQDGADNALLHAIDITHDSRRFSRLVIGSGDGIFTDLALKAARSGMQVEQVVGRGRPSRRLMAACTLTTQLPFDQVCGHGLVLAA